LWTTKLFLEMSNSAIIPIKGNAQTHFADDGMEHLHWHHLRLLARPDLTVYHPRTWKTNVRNLMLQLQRHDVQHVLFIGYSHGQAAIMKAARMAPDYGIKSIRVVLCDPVWRSRALPRWGWRRLLASDRSCLIRASESLTPSTASIGLGNKSITRGRMN
jgi:hypothetical protein